LEAADLDPVEKRGILEKFPSKPVAGLELHLHWQKSAAGSYNSKPTRLRKNGIGSLADAPGDPIQLNWTYWL
jgi:hypothetical protein